jgi:outer membrane protein assembly factor BamD (BamD/ComL family)
MRLLASAYAQLRAGQPARALATIEQHERRFPSGSLTESREVARVLALCALGRKQDARDEATGFLATHPGSPFTARVRAVCAE